MSIGRKSFSTFTLAVLLSASCLAAAEVKFSPKKSIAIINASKKSPKVDGKISPGEYFGAFENFGIFKHNNPFLASRQAAAFVALDDKYVYFAMRSELPDADSGVKLKNRYKRRDSRMYADDNVEFLFLPPKGKSVYHIIANSSNYTYDYQYPIVNGGIDLAQKLNWTPQLRVRSTIKDNYWTIELRIPLKDINLTPEDAFANWKIQCARSWKNPDQQCAINQVLYFINPDEMNDIVFAKSTPSVRFITLGNDYRNGKNNIHYAVDNPTDKVQKVKYSINIMSEAAPRSKEGTVTVAPGKTENIILSFNESSKVNNDLKAVFYDSNNKIIYCRNLNWCYPLEKRWIAPDMKSSAELEFGIYPYYNKVRARLGNTGVPFDMRNVKSANIFIADEKGTPVGKKYALNKVENAGYIAEFPLDLSKKGFYFLTAEIIDKNDKTTFYKQKFEFDKFEWEHNNIGRDRIVLPPYKALEYADKNIKTLLAEYTINNGFFSAISSGKAKKLLAAPITLTVNGKVPVESNFKWLEKSPDRGISISTLNVDNAKFEVKNEIEFDNFVKTTMTVDPGKSFNFKSMTLDIPINGEFAKLIHSTCNRMRYNFANALPDKDGEIWNSAMGEHHSAISNNFRPYIWIGKLGEGLAFFAENDKNWSRDPKKAMAQIIRKDGVATLRINFVDTPVVRKEPFTIVFGFQATPTRLRPNEARQFSGRGSGPNTVVASVLAGSKCWSSVEFDFFPYNHDYSYLNALRDSKGVRDNMDFRRKVVTEFMNRNCKEMTKDQWKNFENHIYRGFSYASFSKYLIPYTNPRATHFRWPEYRVFMDEWFCSEYRANNEDAYNNTTCESYQDYVLFMNQKLLREGLDGIYYDNIRDWQNPNPVTGPAYVLPSGKIQPYFDLFDMRNFIKRTAVQLYKEGKTFFDGRPLLYLHMTNTNIVPFTSFAGVTLECEAHYGSRDFQDRFSKEYMLCGPAALQSGSIPEVLIKNTGNDLNFVTRTFVATILAMDINSVMTAGGVTNVYYKTMYNLRHFGYGTDKVAVYPSYEPSGDFKSDVDVCISEYRHVNGTRMVAVSSYGYAGKVKLSWNYAAKAVTDAENGSPMQLIGDNAVEFDLKKHDFKLIKITK